MANMLVLVVVCTIFAAGKVSAADEPVYTATWAVEITKGGENMADELAERYGFKNLGKIQIGGDREFYKFELIEVEQHNLRSDSPYTSMSDHLSHDSHIGLVEQQAIRKRVLKAYEVPQDPLFPEQWQLRNAGQQGYEFIGYDLNVEKAWLQGLTGCNVTVTVVDDGMEFSHSDLWDNFAPSISYDFINDVPYFPYGKNPWHGTSCSGIAGAAVNHVCGAGIGHEVNLGGVALIPYNMDITEAESLTLRNDIVDIYSNSWGPNDDGRTVAGPEEITKYALYYGTLVGRYGKGSIFVWANGNGGQYYDDCAADGYASSIYTISIGAIGVDGNPSFFDEGCSAKMVVTYVTDIYDTSDVSTTALYDDCTSSFGGTSAATPLASGVIALTLEANPDLTWRDVQYLIVYTSNPYLTNYTNSQLNCAYRVVSRQFGFGVMDAEAMVTRARHWINVPPQIQDYAYPYYDYEGYATEYEPLVIPVVYYGYIYYLEHLVVSMTINVASGIRGGIKIEATSPCGTKTVLLDCRPLDYSYEGYEEWPFMSVMHWGENPYGEWNITVSICPYTYTVAHVNLTELYFYGVNSTPEAVANIPYACHPDCKRGCAGEGSEYCDACVNLRDAYTLECIDECPPGYTERNGYCYDSSAEWEECISPLKDKPPKSRFCDYDEFLCPFEFKCLPFSARCDGYEECKGGFDELNCSTIEFTSPRAVDEGTDGILDFCLTVTNVLEDYIYRQYYLHLYDPSSDLEFMFYDKYLIFNGSYYEGQSECVHMHVKVPENNLVEGTKEFNSRVDSIPVQIFIIDNDYLEVGFHAHYYHVPENAYKAELIVGPLFSDYYYTPEVGFPLAVRATTRDGTAYDGLDYYGIQETYHINPGEPPYFIINIYLINDRQGERNETFSVELEAFDASVILGYSTADVVIVDDETFCTVVIEKIRVTQWTVTYTFTPMGSAIEGFTCKLDGEPLPDCSGTITGVSPGIHRLRVKPFGCDKNEAVSETFRVF